MGRRGKELSQDTEQESALSRHPLPAGAEAVRRFTKATQLNPTLCRCVGMSLPMQKNYADAVAPLEAAAKLQAGEPCCALQLATAYGAQGVKKMQSVNICAAAAGCGTHRRFKFREPSGATAAAVSDSITDRLHFFAGVFSGHWPAPLPGCAASLTPCRIVISV
ncbi:MAG TPA: hypothetical protein VK638_29520 [Edaphobacter sp.]|nr:hypothetical protein [Edaphobacter sp.]